MDVTSIINVLLLCILNVSFMVAGIFLNSVVIISLWRSPQLRMKPCYFMILVLSCFDLTVVTSTHPALMLSTILWSFQIHRREIKVTREYIFLLLVGSSMFALFTLTVERFLSVKFPIFHRTSVTKRRLLFSQTFFLILVFAMSPVNYYYGKTVGNMLISAFLLFFLLAFVFLNYKMLVIVKSKCKNGRGDSTAEATISQEDRRKSKLNLKSISTCSLACCCYFICSIPSIVYSAWRITSNTPSYDRHVLLFHIWTSTFASMNSTFNCLIFFWRNSILRREGRRTVKCFFTK